MTDLDPARITALLHTRRYGRSLDVRAETGSTSDDARAAAASGAPDGHVVLADAQTAGRGRHGHAWSSPAGSDLYFSIVARTGLDAARLPPLTLAVGVAIAEVAETHAGRPAKVKWPNDVWLGDRKVAGILVETSTRDGRTGAAIVGVGLNVGRREWPDELRTIATSLAESAGEPVDRVVVLAAALDAIEAWVDRLIEHGPSVVVDALDRRLALRGERVVVDGVEGELLGVAPTGAALVRTALGVRELVAGTTARAPRAIHGSAASRQAIRSARRTGSKS